MRRAKKENCGNCRFYKSISPATDEIVYGDCLRYAPRPVLSDSFVAPPDDNVAWWPSVEIHQWCGDWEEGDDNGKAR